MKTTIDIPDDLYRKIKAKAALQGASVRRVTIDLYRRWLGEEGAGPAEASPEAWLETFLALGRATLGGKPEGPTATEILEEGRRRLERR